MDGPFPGGVKPAGFFYCRAPIHKKTLPAHRRRQRCEMRDKPAQSTAFTISSMTFFASPNTIIVFD
jgi:hypothetical protein